MLAFGDHWVGSADKWCQMTDGRQLGTGTLSLCSIISDDHFGQLYDFELRWTFLIKGAGLSVLLLTKPTTHVFVSLLIEPCEESS